MTLNTIYLQYIFQLRFTISAYIFSARSNKLFGKQYEDLNKMDKFMSFIGFSANYFKIRGWSESDTDDGIYTKLAYKHKIWSVMFETFPSMGLQIYATLDSTGLTISMTLISSIIFSCLNVAFSVWRYI